MHTQQIKIILNMDFTSDNNKIQIEGDGLCFCSDCSKAILIRSSTFIWHYLAVLMKSIGIGKEKTVEWYDGMGIVINDFCQDIANHARKELLAEKKA